MIVLDTNVISELMQPTCDPRVLAWMNAQVPASLYTTSLCQAEVLSGIAMLPRGKRRDSLATAARDVFEKDFGGRVLAFGGTATRAYADIIGDRRRAGRPIATIDALVAAIARTLQASVATRNVADFEGCGIVVVDPWRARPH